jgi:hypothetical protein
MQTTCIYQCIASKYTRQNKQLVEWINRAHPVEKVYLLGLTLQKRRTETLFTKGSATAGFLSHYYLLILVTKSHEHTINCVQDKIESNCQHYIPVTCIVCSIDEFNAWLSEGHVFANTVVEKAEKLYDAGNISFNHPGPVN